MQRLRRSDGTEMGKILLIKEAKMCTKMIRAGNCSQFPKSDQQFHPNNKSQGSCSSLPKTIIAGVMKVVSCVAAP